MSASHDGALSARRKSFGFFTRPTMLPEIEPASTWSSRDHVIKQRPKSAFFSNGAGDYQEYTTVVSSNVGTHARPRVLTKSPAQRPKSMFGSLRPRDRDPGSPVIGMHFESSGSSSIDSSQSDNVPISPSNKFVVYSGEVISTGGLLRRKKEFMVLTNEELLRYKSEHKASEAIGIPTRSPTTGRAPSIGSVGELSNEHSLVTSAIQIVAVYRYGGDADLACTVQVDHLDDANGTPSSTVLQVSTPQEAQGWLEILRQVTHLARTAKSPPPFSNSTVEHIARRLEAEKDYSPSHFQIFRVVQRAAKMNGHKAGSSEDLQKMYSTICYLVIGIHKIHLVPIPKTSPNRSTTSLSAATSSSYATLNLSGLTISDTDDSFTLSFRSPCRAAQKLHLASVDASDIIQAIRQASEYLRPNYLITPFIGLPEYLNDAALPDIPCTPGDDFNGFDRTLSAYCTAYDLDASNIVYGVHMEVEDAPQFVLYPPAFSRRRQYTDLELLAVMRSLRWNESFCSISFRGINLETLHKVHENYGSEYEPLTDRSNQPLNLKATPLSTSFTMSYSKKDEDADQAIFKVDRTSVFQEARLFNTSPISPRKCRILLTKITYLLHTGERFPTSEATSLFFGITKLFQHRDASLRQMVYLVIKELADTAEDVIMVTSSVMKDVAGGGRGAGEQEVYRANAIRALCRIIDGTTVQAIERLLKTAIVDKNPSVSSAALVSAYHLLPTARDVVRRWANETQEAALSGSKSGGFSLGFGSSAASVPQGSGMTQYHAIGLLYQMRSHDRMALVKMVQQFANGTVKNPAAVIMLVRLAAKIADEDPSLRKPMYALLEGWLRHKAEMVNFEAAKAICELRDVTDAEVAPAINVLQLYLTSPRAVAKFTAIRILHNFASIRPSAVNVCNMDIETLLNNSNRSIATFAITTLLKTGNETSVDRLIGKISGLMADITDEFKITIVEAIRTLCLKFPSKQAAMLTFLSGVLRDEGGYEFKKTVVESMFDLIKFVPESREEALAHLCEFIEDCEFTKLAVRILHLLGTEGPKTTQPTKYIRYIYNRVVLENAVVRAAAVTALAKFGVASKEGEKVDPEVKKSVVVLLTRCLDDPDDEVRDRAALNLRLIQQEDGEEVAERFIKNESSFSLPIFEHQLVMYVTGDASTFSQPFDISSIPIVTRAEADAEDRSFKLRSTTMPTLKAPTSGAPRPSAGPSAAAEAVTSAAAASAKYIQQLAAVPELKPYGPVLKSSREVELTESETEYVVVAVKHIFKEHIVLQFNVKNTLTDTVLEDVSMITTPSDPEGGEGVGLEEDFIIPAPKLGNDEEGTIYVAFKRTGEESNYATATFTNVLKFTSKEIDPSTGEPEDQGFEDEYQVEDLELTGGDYVVPNFTGSFGNVWEQVGAAGEEVTETFSLGTGVKGIQEACELLSQTLSLQALEGSDVAVSTSTHNLKLFGKTISGGRVVAEVKMAYSSKTGVALKITVRAEEEGVAALIVGSVA